MIRGIAMPSVGIFLPLEFIFCLPAFGLTGTFARHGSRFPGRGTRLSGAHL